MFGGGSEAEVFGSGAKEAPHVSPVDTEEPAYR